MSTLRQRSKANEPTGPSEPIQEDLSTLLDPATCTRKGLCPVTKLRGQSGQPLESHSLYYEMHGSGPEKIVFIMGLNGSFLSWIGQVEHFGRSPDHSVLVFDNRGVGNSGTPRGPYSTRGMAEDVIALLDFVGWTENRSVHIVGISLGGMISMELASRVPERLVSLTLAVTTAGGPFWTNFPPWFGLITLLRLLFITDRKKGITLLIEMLYSKAWLDTRDSEGRTNRDTQAAALASRLAVIRPQQPMGALSQMWAGLTHHVSAQRLRGIAEGVPKVTIVTGTDDNLVDPRNSRYLAANMPGAELVEWTGTGHGVQIERMDEFNALLHRGLSEGRNRVAR